MKKQIETQFDSKALPRWAQSHPEIVALCERNYTFRCNVCAAKTAQYRRFLVREAERLAR